MALVTPLVLAVALAAPDGFGGTKEAAALDCSILGDDGVWRSCSDVLRAQEGVPPPVVEELDAESNALRERLKAADELHSTRLVVPKETKLELELHKAHLDPSMPLLAVRIEVERARDLVKALESTGTGGKLKDEAELRVAEAELILDALERIAIHRMDVCSQRRGNKPIVRTFRMTVAGPVVLSASDMMAQLPIVDPSGCERITLIDADVVTRVKRLQELRRILATTSFGYRDVAKRKELEKELKVLTTELAKDAIPALSAPGVKDPYRR